MQRPESPWDPGLQIERTTLAWLRTTLTFVVGILVLMRLLAHQSAVMAAICAAIALSIIGVISRLIWRRHVQGEHRLREKAPLPGGALPAAVAGLAVFAGCAGLIYVLAY